MNRATFDDYIARFNARDASAFDDYIAPDMQMLNGALRFEGATGMRHHYQALIWPHFDETLKVLRFVSDDAHAAVEMRTTFVARAPAGTLFGQVEAGERFVYHGVIFYDIVDGRFTAIQVAYNSFTNIKPDGREIAMGLPH